MRGKQAGTGGAPAPVLTRRQLEEETTIRIANLSDDTEEQDVRRLCEGFGPLARIFLSRDKETGRCKGFAFVCYRLKENAARAIQVLNGRGYDNLILHVEWANRESNK
jgi:translation initiation factor 3 subunit G